MLKRSLVSIFVAIGVHYFAEQATASPTCSRYLGEVERECGLDVQFYSVNGSNELLITGGKSLDASVDYVPKEVCKYPAVAGFLSVHSVGAICEEMMNLAGNLCFREGISAPESLDLREIIAQKNCEMKSVILFDQPNVSRVFLWGSGFIPTEKILRVDNEERYLELRPNPIDGDDIVSDTNQSVKLSFDDDKFAGIKNLLNKIRIEYLSPDECAIRKKLMTQNLNGVDLIMADGTSPQVEVHLEGGSSLDMSGCVDVQGFFPTFNEVVEAMMAPFEF